LWSLILLAIFQLLKKMLRRGLGGHIDNQNSVNMQITSFIR
jgi:hypothetical protein